MQLFPLFSLLFVSRTQPVKDTYPPSCKECVHYKPYPYLTEEYASKLGRCKKFGYKDILTGDIVFNYADLTRLNQNQCSTNGTHFESRIPNK
jgi:hypothetical protein